MRHNFYGPELFPVSENRANGGVLEHSLLLPAVVSSYVQCQCLAVAVQDRRARISREVTKLQPAACQGFLPSSAPTKPGQLAQQYFLNQIPINFFIAAFRFPKK